MKKFTIRLSILLPLTAILLAGQIVTAADISSTAREENGVDKTTWLGGVVPTENDNVIITSTVTANGGSYSSTSYPDEKPNE
ncbi:MAG: hypothetical protein U5K79_08335 [Cyclobacteriaceae bacterium]|nr:hypothetical protein [Cyclobacteriaceae bacterium]